MNDIAKKFLTKEEKEAAKKWLRAQLMPLNPTQKQRQEVEKRVEYAAHCADYIEELSKTTNIDMRILVTMMFGPIG